MVNKNLSRPQLLLVMYLSRKRSLSSRLKQRKLKVFNWSSISFQIFGPKYLILNYLKTNIFLKTERKKLIRTEFRT